MATRMGITAARIDRHEVRVVSGAVARRQRRVHPLNASASPSCEMCMGRRGNRKGKPRWGAKSSVCSLKDGVVEFVRIHKHFAST